MLKRFSFRKMILTLGVISLITVSLSSCHEDGCPGKITQTGSIFSDENT